MKHTTLPVSRVRQILSAARKARALVIGDVMLDHFIWGQVGRISPEAPVPVLEFDRESYIPGGAGNVARNLTALAMPTELFGVVGQDGHARHLKDLLTAQNIGCSGLQVQAGRLTTTKTRIVAHQQQVVRLDRESRHHLDSRSTKKLLAALQSKIPGASAVIVGDYGKGVVSQDLLDEVKCLSRQYGVWLSLDPKPVHPLNLEGLSLITPNRKEAFELARIPDNTRKADPLQDRNLLEAVRRLLDELKPVLLLVTLGELGMLLCARGKRPFHIPTQAKEVYDVSGAGDTVIASFTLAIAAGASPMEAAILSNHAAGIVVGKIGTAVTTPDELLKSFENS